MREAMKVKVRVSKGRTSVDAYIRRKIRSGEKLHFTLIDPEKVQDRKALVRVAKQMVDAGTDGFLVGGSVGVSERDIDEVVKVLKDLKKPVILFPGNVSGVSRYADAILFMSLLNSDDPYFIIEAPVLGAPLVYRYGIEVLPTAYIIVGYGSAAGFIGRARPIPFNKPEIGVAYALAARYLGKKYIYFEAGSGSPEPIPGKFIKEVSKVKGDSVLIVGGGIRSPEKATEIIRGGADVIVTGTIVERSPEKATEIVNAVKQHKLL